MDQLVLDLGGLIVALIFIFLPAFLGGISLLRKKELPFKEKAELLLLYYVVISVGIQGWMMGLFELFFPQSVADFDHWTFSPFILEVGMANLVFGILGLMSIWIKGSWRESAAVGYGLFLLFAGVNRIMSCWMACSWTIGTMGMLWAELLVPLVLFVLVGISFCSGEKEGDM